MSTKENNTALQLEGLLLFLNEPLPELERSRKEVPADLPPVEADTLLFETGRIDSLSILPLIAHIEEQTGTEIPTRLIVMKHFRSPQSIIATFSNPDAESAPDQFPIPSSQ